MEETKNKTALNLSGDNIVQFKQYLVRLFGMPVVRSTIREFHSFLVRFVGGNEALIKTFMEAFLQGKVPTEMKANELLCDLIEQFSPLVRLAKEVHDRGDFLNFVTADQVDNQDSIVFHHFLRTVDGREMRFVTDIPTIAQVIHHLSQRLAEAAGAESSQKSLAELKPLLRDAGEKLQHALKMAEK